MKRLIERFKRLTQQEAKMADTHSVTGLTDAQLAHLEEHVDERNATVSADVDARIAAAVAPLADRIAQLEAEAVKYGAHVSLKADAGQFMCAENGGPAKEKDPFKLTGRSTNGAWESFALVKGSQ